MGLLNYLTATSLDEDYAQAHAARAEQGASAAERRSVRPRTAALVVLALFGILVATAAVQTSRGAADADARHAELVKQVVARKQTLADERDRARSLRSETQTLQRVYLQATAEGRALQTRLTRLGRDHRGGAGTRTGSADRGRRRAGGQRRRQPGPRRGPAEDGQRAVALRRGGDRDQPRAAHQPQRDPARRRGDDGELPPHLAPYTVEAIGNPDNLAARFVDTPGGQWWLDLQALYGLKFEINTVPDQEPLTLPAARRTALRHAHAPETLR